MLHTIKHILLVLVLILPAALRAQVKISVQAPAQCEVGQRIRVTYSVNSQDISDFRVNGDFEGFEVLFGPSVSSSNSISIINGKTTQSSSRSYTYTLMASKEGTFSLPLGQCTCQGNQLRSNSAKVQVLASSGSNGTAGQGSGSAGGRGNYSTQQGGSTAMHTPSTDEKIGSKDLYMTATASKTHVFEQEAILLTYKLYSLVTVEQLSGDIPKIDGFHVQEIELPQQRSFSMEQVNGRTYGTVVWRQYVIFPQMSGKLTIPAVEYTADVVVQDRYVDPIDAFFNGASLSSRVNKKVIAPAVNIQVDPLPSKPANFSGAVGSGFDMHCRLMPEQVDAGDATTLSIQIKGTGNLKLMSAPEIEWPRDFETYDPKQSEKVKLTSAGNVGVMNYDYVVVPRHGGKYSISPVQFCYFDTDSKSYKTIQSDSLYLAVAKGQMSDVTAAPAQESLKDLGVDIRYIKTGAADSAQVDAGFFGSLIYIIGYVVVLLVFLTVLFIFRQQAKANADVARRRGKKAGREAAKRLKAANKLLKAGQSNAFYEELMHALWNYVGDKLNLPVTELNKDNVSEALMNRAVSTELTQQFLTVLSDCEFARFAPGDPAATMDKLYADATEVINQLDSAIK